MATEKLALEDNLVCPLYEETPVYLNFGDDFKTHLVYVYRFNSLRTSIYQSSNFKRI